MGMTHKFTINHQIAEVLREISMRETTYPRRVSEGKLKQKNADYQMGGILAVLKTLQYVKENDAAFRAYQEAKDKAA